MRGFLVAILMFGATCVGAETVYKSGWTEIHVRTYIFSDHVSTTVRQEAGFLFGSLSECEETLIKRLQGNWTAERQDKNLVLSRLKGVETIQCVNIGWVEK